MTFVSNSSIFHWSFGRLGWLVHSVISTGALPSFSWAMRLCLALMLASNVLRFSRSYSLTSAATRSKMSSGEGDRLRVLLWGLLGSDTMLVSSFAVLYFCVEARGGKNPRTVSFLSIELSADVCGEQNGHEQTWTMAMRCWRRCSIRASSSTSSPSKSSNLQTPNKTSK